MSNYISPFPTVGELVGFIINAFDGYKLIEPALDGDTLEEKDTSRKTITQNIGRIKREKSIDFENASEVLSDVLGKIFEGILDDNKVLSYLNVFVKTMLNKYQVLVLETSVDGADRVDVLYNLIFGLFIPDIAHLINSIKNNKLKKIDLPTDQFWYLPDFEDDKIVWPIEKVLNWFVEYTKRSSLKEVALEIEDRENVITESALYKSFNRWKNNKVLPTASNIIFITDSKNKKKLKKLNPQQLNSLKLTLLVSRAMQFCYNRICSTFKPELGPILVNKFKEYVDNNFKISNNEFVSRQINYIKQQIEQIEASAFYDVDNEFWKKGALLAGNTSLIKQKTEESENGLKGAIDYLLKHEKLQLHPHFYQILWYTARYYVLSNKMDKALEYYIKAFERAKYCAGKYTKEVIREGFTLASYMIYNEMKGKGKISTFENMYKWGIYYKLFSQPYNEVNDYIYDLQRKQFFTLFRIDNFYKSVSSKEIKKFKKIEQSYFPSYLIDEVQIRKDDLKNPNRWIKDVFPRPRNLLMISIMYRNFDNVVKLIDAGADPKLQASDGSTALILSFDSRDDRIVNLLLDQDLGESINARTKMKKQTALLNALELEMVNNKLNIEVIKKIIEKDADINQTGTIDEVSPLYLLLLYFTHILKKRSSNYKYKSDKDVIKGYNSNDILKMCGNPLFDDEIIRVNKNLESNTDFKRISGIVGDVFREKKINNKNEIKLLLDLFLEVGADTNQKQKNGFTPFLFSAELGNVDIFKKLLKHGGNINSMTSQGGTILTQSLWFNNFNLTLFILDELNVSEIINVSNQSDDNALHCLLIKYEECKNNKEQTDRLEEICDRLLEKGIDKNQKNDENKTAKDYAIAYNNYIILEKLAEKTNSGLIVY